MPIELTPTELQFIDEGVAKYVASAERVEDVSHDGILTGDELMIFGDVVEHHIANCQGEHGEDHPLVRLKELSEILSWDAMFGLQQPLTYWRGIGSPDAPKLALPETSERTPFIHLDFFEGDGDGITSLDELAVMRVKLGMECSIGGAAEIEGNVVIVAECEFDESGPAIKQFDKDVESIDYYMGQLVKRESKRLAEDAINGGAGAAIIDEGSCEPPQDDGQSSDWPGATTTL